MKTRRTSGGPTEELLSGTLTPSSRRRPAENGTEFLCGKRILIVDDSPAVRSFAKVGLMGHKVELIEAESGDRALRLLRVLAVDLVLADVNMPGTDGLSLARQLSASDRASLRKIPVILMSAEAVDGLRDRALQSGAQAFLKKPFASDELMAVVSRLLRRRE